MKAGVIGTIDGNFDEINSQANSRQQDGTTFTQSLQINRKSHLDSGETIYHGEAAIEIVDEKETVNINEESGEIAVTTSSERTGKYTQFLVISDTMMVVDSGNGEFAYNLLQDFVPGISVQRANLDLNAYADEYYSADVVDPWQVGFYGNIGQAEKGVVYGEEVFNDDEMGDLLDRSQLNQLGLNFEEHDQGVEKVTMAQSGYIEVYLPSNMDGSKFADYLINEIVNYVETPE